MKLNVKKALIALVAIVAVVVIGFTISPMNKQEGDKSITITILNDETKETLLENKVLKTDADSLGDVLVQYKDELQLEAEESEYGLYITGFLGLSAKENGATTIGITNNPDSTIAKTVDYHIQTATREKLFLNEFYFSRVSATTIIEILYLFLTVGQQKSYERLSKCENLMADEKL